VTPDSVIANGRPVEAALPCSIEAFLVAQGLLPRGVVVQRTLARSAGWS